MTLGEAIKHCEEVAQEKENEACNFYDAKNYEESRDCIWCAEEHKQLAKWLRDYKRLLEQEPVLDKIRAEIELKHRIIFKDTPKDDWAVKWNDCLDEVLEIFNKCKAESETNIKALEQEPCEDCISRADVEQTVEDNILCYTHSDRPIDQDPDTDCHKAIRIALRMLRKDLKKLPPVTLKPKIGHWISVNERLPERYKAVIVTDIETSDTYQSEYVGNGYWECDNGTLKNRIIAWMPLPKPYKSESVK